MKIAEKDWTRMLELVLLSKNGAGIASTIKDKNKAVCRYVAGLKLSGATLKPNPKGWQPFYGEFEEFGNRAVKLGATIEEIKDTYCENVVPKEYTEKMLRYAGKRLNNRFVGELSKKILDAGFDVAFESHSGNAISFEGKDAMRRNGRKWTIGYKAQINVKGMICHLVFDAITDEGDGPTSYMIVDHMSSPIFGKNNWKPLGKTAFFTKVMNALATV